MQIKTMALLSPTSKGYRGAGEIMVGSLWMDMYIHLQNCLLLVSYILLVSRFSVGFWKAGVIFLLLLEPVFLIQISENIKLPIKVNTVNSYNHLSAALTQIRNCFYFIFIIFDGKLYNPFCFLQNKGIIETQECY